MAAKHGTYLSAEVGEVLMFWLAGVAQRLFAASKDSKYGKKFKLQRTFLAFTMSYYQNSSLFTMVCQDKK